MVNEETLTLLDHLKNADGPLSGVTLSQALGVSRVALWKRFEALRAAGYPVAAGRSGYWLEPSDKPLPWEFPGDEASTFHFETLESTMDEAFRLGLEGLPRAAVVAERQSAGRGRHDRRWVSGGGDLLVTLLLRPGLPLSMIGALGLEALSQLAETLQALHNLELTVKWPNDLVWGEHKVAGVLIEACGVADRPRFYTVGLGLNVHGLPTLDRPTASLDTLAAAAVDRRSILSRWRSGLERWCQQPELHPERWEHFAFRSPALPLAVETFDGLTHQGIPSGFDRAGSLLLRGPQQPHPIRYGEVRRTTGATR